MGKGMSAFVNGRNALRGIFLWFVMSSANEAVLAQIGNPSDEPTDALISRHDTLQASLPATPFVPAGRPPEEKAPPARYTSTKSPAVAVLLSAVVPGAGQIYNESYWKPPIIWGLGAYWVYEWLTLNDKYLDFRSQFSQNPNNAQLKRVRDFYRDERDKFAWYLGVLYFANLLDAYIGASLYDFNVTPDLSADGRVVPRITATLRVRF